MSEKTISKYEEVLRDLHWILINTKTTKEKRPNYLIYFARGRKANNNLLTVLREYKIIDKLDGLYEWVGPKPNRYLAKRVLIKINEKAQKSKAKRKGKNTSNQAANSFGIVELQNYNDDLLTKNQALKELVKEKDNSINKIKHYSAEFKNTKQYEVEGLEKKVETYKEINSNLENQLFDLNNAYNNLSDESRAKVEELKELNASLKARCKSLQAYNDEIRVKSYKKTYKTKLFGFIPIRLKPNYE